MVELVGSQAQNLGVGHRIDRIVVALSFKTGITLSGRKRLGLHHDPIEIVVSRGEVFHHFKSLVGAAVECAQAIFDHVGLLAEPLFTRSLEEGENQGEHSDSHNDADCRLPQRRAKTFAGRRVDTFVAVGGRIVSVEYFMTHHSED